MHHLTYFSSPSSGAQALRMRGETRASRDCATSLASGKSKAGNDTGGINVHDCLSDVSGINVRRRLEEYEESILCLSNARIGGSC